jgi:hypothetical protein
MALKQRSLFLYGYEVNSTNYAIDFRTTSMETIRQASLTYGFYSLTGLLTEIARAMNAVDSTHTFAATADRTISGGTQNRITIPTTSAYFELDFASGPRTSVNAASLLGFTATDKTGATTYTGSLTSGTAFSPSLVGYNYLSPDFYHKVFGSLNISASGQKESIVFQIQKFFQVQFKYEPEADVIASWKPLVDWMIQQKPLEFTPDITAPSTFYECTLESAPEDGKGLGWKFVEMLPNFPFQYDTGLLKFRQKPS